jgi:prepilin-type N-terminal cleavage/methylation domain-containing protein
LKTFFNITLSLRSAIKRSLCFFKKDYRSELGFTLIEILIVITLIAMIGGLFFTRKSNKGGLASSVEANRIASVLSQCYHSAIIGNKVIRLNFENDQRKITYQSAPPGTLMPEEKELKPGETAPKGRGNFDDDSSLSKKPFTYRKDVTIARVVVNGEETNYIYCFPQGFIQSATVYLSEEGDIRQRVTVSSLTGKTDVVRGWNE